LKTHPHTLAAVSTETPASAAASAASAPAFALPPFDRAPHAGASGKATSGQATRDRILATAIELMVCSDLQRFSINAVIRAGGFSKGSFFFHFDGMDALCRACHERVHATMLPLPDAGGCRDLRGFLQDIGTGPLLNGSARRWFTLSRFFEAYAALRQESGAHLPDLTELLRDRLSKDVNRLAGRVDARRPTWRPICRSRWPASRRIEVLPPIRRRPRGCGPWRSRQHWQRWPRPSRAAQHCMLAARAAASRTENCAEAGPGHPNCRKPECCVCSP
jgi:AcrR family transcriptional regulator